MDIEAFAHYLKYLRLQQGLRQADLAEALQVSFQAVSKWERGESLPDTALLLPLADLLHTSVDLLLNGGKIVMDQRKFMSLEQVVKGFEAIENVGKYFGTSSTFYQGMVDGINKRMNIDIESYLADPTTREVMMTEVLIQHIMEGGQINLDEAREYIHNPKMIQHLINYQENYQQD